jgi:superfamily II DNA or RNA helicase
MNNRNNDFSNNAEIVENELKIERTSFQPRKFSFPAICLLKFPFDLKDDQLAAVDSWMTNSNRGTILYSTGTGKTEIAFECAKRLASLHLSSETVEAIIKVDKIGRTNLILENKRNGDSNTKEFKIALAEGSGNNEHIPYSFFNILFLVPRISLIDQTIDRLVAYGIPKEKVGAYFSERKEKKEIMICTYHSVIRNPLLIRRSSIVIFDEVHLIRDTSKSFIKIFDIVVEDPKRAILGLTATLDERDFKNSTILAVLPPIIKYPIKKAVKDKRLAKPVVIPIKVSLTEKELREYDMYSTKIKNISNKFKRYDVDSMTNLLKKGGFASGMAKAWFSNIRKRKLLLSYAENKLAETANIIQKKFPDEKIMVFSETIESIERLRDILMTRGIESKIIDAKVKAIERQRILNDWGTTFNVLLSVHTLEIGYDVPQVRIEIILATTSNINQIVQRIGRVLRKYDGKNIALIYVVYVPDTKDDNVIDVVKKAVTAENDEIGIHQKQKLKRSVSKSVAGETPISSLPSPIHHKKSKNPAEKTDLSNKIKKRSKDAIINKVDRIENHENRVLKAYDIVESSLNKASIMVEENFKTINTKDQNGLHLVEDKITSSSRLYKVKSSVNKDKIYLVDLEKQSCTCGDFIYRHVKCKHIIATEIISP